MITSGIYTITCVGNGKVYCGSSGDIPRRWLHHLSALRNGRHKCLEMQVDFYDFCENAFAFRIVAEELQPSIRLQKERDLIRSLMHGGLLYNSQLDPMRPDFGEADTNDKCQALSRIDSNTLTPDQVKAIRDQVGGTKAMAERLHIRVRAARSLCQHGATRLSTIERLKALTPNSLQGGMRVVSEPEFRTRLTEVIASLPVAEIGSVTGPGRSGAVAAVYASHLLGVPFLPHGAKCPVHLGRLLIIDTARESGATLRKAERRYSDANPVLVACFEEPPRVAFWYEAVKPQRFRHELPSAA